jgi:hypothetical protein
MILADPPEDPPDVTDCKYGFRVIPWISLIVCKSNPKGGMLDFPRIIAPAFFNLMIKLASN